MAAMDLCAEMLRMSEQSKIEEAMERRICAAFIKHLKDSSPDVQSIAVKSIQQIAPIIKDQNLIMIVESLASDVVDSNKKEVRDIFSLAIRSTIDELKGNSAVNMIKTIYPKLI
jgi:vesicle coat complex subunit